MAELLQEGEPAPDFDLATDGDGRVRLSDLKGKRVVLYFYPKDNTPGCTVQAVDFTAMKAAFEKAGATIIGVSADSAASHDKFVAKQNLKIRLASDPERDVIQAYGAWGEKNMYGKKTMGLIRSTFLIDEDGVVRRIWRNVRAKGHAEKVLDAVKEMNG